MKKKNIFIFFTVLVLSLTGCATRTIDQMYTPPRRSSDYSNLQSVIDRSMVGMEYASPMSGDNQQTIQMADLTGNGTEECLVFAKDPSAKMLYILVFAQNEAEKYSQLDRIECNGSNFERVEYVDVDGHPGKDIVIGRSLNNDILSIASVFSFSSGQSDQIMSTVYSKFLTLDIDSDGRSDLFVIREAEGEKANASAVIYSFRNDAVERSMEAELSENASHIRRMTVSKLSSGEPAVFIASDYPDNLIITDIFAMKKGNFVNLTFSEESRMSVQTLRNYYLYAEDIDSDGILEMPSLVTMRAVSQDGQQEDQYMIRWYSRDLEGNERTKMYSFHNFADSWYILLNTELAPKMAVEQNGRNYTFYLWNEVFTEANPIFTIYTLTGKDRDSQATEMNHFALYRGENVVYSGGLGMYAAQHGFTESFVTENFHLISQAWKNGET